MAAHVPITDAPTRAPFNASRRLLLGAIATAPVVIAAPAVAAQPVIGFGKTPFAIAEARYREALDRFNNMPSGVETDDPDRFDREELAYGDAYDAVTDAPIADWREFARAFEIACNEGQTHIDQDRAVRLLGEARALLAEARR